MKLSAVFTALLTVTGISAFAQSKPEGLKVTYKAYRILDIPYEFQTVLYMEQNIALWQELQNTREIIKDKPLSDEIKKMPPIAPNALKVNAAPCIRTDLLKKEILFHGGILQSWVVVKDNFTVIDWDITNETKTVSGYACVKAKGHFRGRDWTVWFCPDIALPFGPWKLRGLPGLIIEAEDTTGTYSYKAVKIENLDDSTVLKKDFALLLPVKKSKPIPYRELLQQTEEAEANVMMEISQKLNIGISKTGTARARQEEITFEWEQ